MNNIYAREYIYYMRFSHLCYISVRVKGAPVRVKLQVHRGRRNFITPDIVRDKTLIFISAELSQTNIYCLMYHLA